ncbi:MAG TPA: NlpC/P60 family protein [Solirubrobacteraceae bacterium]|nr:NlpC/P60 family protein [Solirubrobacteraceae bacterium]
MPRTLLVILVALGAALLSVTATAGGASVTSSAREAAVGWAVAQDGTHERGTTNCSPKIDRWQRDMGLKVPPCRVWCGAFVHQAFLRAGVRLSRRLIDPDRSYSDAIAGARGLKRISSSQIRRGDIVFYNFREDTRASHLAIALGRPSGGSLNTVEGNTSHAVRLEQRGLQYIVLAARVVGAG